MFFLFGVISLAYEVEVFSLACDPLLWLLAFARLPFCPASTFLGSLSRVGLFSYIEDCATCKLKNSS